ncbi:MAG: GAF domain-containing protein, partial [Pirellulales bacterium]
MSIFHDVGKELHRVLGSAIGESFMKHQAILAAVAQGVPLELVLERILAAIEDESPEIIGSVLLLDRDHQSMRCAASRGLPEVYCNAINGLKIGPQAGSCGTAIYFGKPVMVSDISTDPLWAGYRELALKYGLRACWSYPLMCGGDKEHRAMGAFAVYSREPGMPDERVTELMRRYQHIACIAIESSLNLTELEESRLRLAEA